MKLVLSPFASRVAFLMALALAAAQPVSAKLAIAKASIPTATAGAPYSFALSVAGGTPPYTWTLLSGGFPTGLSLTPSGVITGTPAVEGSWAYGYPYQMYIGVTDATGASTAVSLGMALQAPPTSFALNVVNGTGGGTYPSGTVVNIAANAAPVGAAFISWSGATVASATSASTTIALPAANTTVTANYAYTVSYNANGATAGSVPSDPNLYVSGTSVLVPGNTGYLFNPGHSFIGWNTSPSGSGTSYRPGATFTMGGASVALYAQWSSQDLPVSVWGGARDVITLKADGTVWTWGLDAYGELGNNATTDQPYPVQVLGQAGAAPLAGIVAVMGGEAHNLALRNDGTVWAWGLNEEDQLGDGNAANSSTPVQVSGLSSIVNIASRGYHSLAVRSDGTVWAWGWDNSGALGIGVADTNFDYTAPVQVQGLNHPLMVSAGYCFSVALLQNHTLVAWGKNTNGQLGDGTTTDRYSPVPVAGLSDVIWVSAGWEHVVAIKSDGTVWTWGANTWAGIYPGSGLLGDGTTADHHTPEQVPGLSGAIQAFGGDSFTAVLLHDGSVWTFGANGAGQLGTGSFALAQSLVPVQVQGLGSNVMAITGRDHHSQALLSDGSIWSWGSGENGELGNGAFQNSATPVEVVFGGSVPTQLEPATTPAALSITKQTPPDATAGTPYSQPLAANGGVPPYTWTLLSGGLPSGLNLTPGGVITGTPAIQGSWAYNTPNQAYIQVTDSTGTSTAWNLSLTLLPPGTYTLKILNGFGGGTYASGTVVPIAASTAPSGEPFSTWTGATVASATSASTTITMPAANATVVATYLASASPPAPTYTLSVVNGTGGGTDAAGTVVAISANAAPSGEAFSSWSGATVASSTSASTTLTMPAANTTVTANYAAVAPPPPPPPAAPLRIPNQTLANPTAGTAYSQALTATGGTPPYTWALLSGGFPEGLNVTSGGVVTGTPAIASWEYGYPFQAYLGVTDSAGATAATTFTMTLLSPPTPTFQLTVVSGSGGGPVAQGATVTIAANAAPAGEVFAHWTGATVANPNAASTTLVMPSANTTVTANYAQLYPLAVVGGTGGGNFVSGASVAITANAAPAGEVFLGWTGAAVANAGATATTLVMPGAATIVTATFGPPPPQFPLTVVGGSGGGSIAEGATVTITAGAAPSGDVFLNWTGATVANPTAATTTLAMPGAATTVTANFGAPPPAYYLTVNSGSGSGQYPAGTVVTIAANAPPTGQVFQSWIAGLPLADFLSPTTTLVMPPANMIISATYALPTSLAPTIPQPVTGHPRLWMTPSDLVKYRSWAIASNPVYAQGLLGLLGAALSAYNTDYFPNGQPAAVSPDLGDTQGYQGDITEQYAAILALNSLIDPNPANRATYAQDARNLIMFAMNQAVQGFAAGVPFRDPLFPTYNRANASSELWPLVVDWIYPVLSAQDKATIRNVFLLWAAQCLNASTAGGDHPSPVGTSNSTALLGASGNAYRMASNNYYLSHARLLTLMSLAFDPADDPPVIAGSPASILGNSLRSYIPNATGAWLYQEYAMLGDPAAVKSAYGLPASASVGLASGGLPPEGMLYGESYAFIFGQLLGLKTAGFADPSIIGPQAALINDPPVFDRFVKGMIASLTPAPFVPPNESYLGSVYQMASYGDVLRLWMTPDNMKPFSLLHVLDAENGDTSRDNDERWWIVNVPQGGAGALLNRIGDPWTWGVQDGLWPFLALDPTAAPATDPRPNYPTAFYDAPQGRLVEHTDWTPNGTMFATRCSWMSINHQQADANQFELYRKGEWLTKGVANYDNNIYGLTCDFHQTLSIQNWCQDGVSAQNPNGLPGTLGWWEGPFWAEGSQWQLGDSAGDPTAQVSVQTAYTYVFGDTTNLYNRPSYWSPANAAMDVLHASRSMIWLKPDRLVIYDRATSHTAGLFKRFNLALTATPVVNGNTITSTTPGGQNLYWTSLLPAGASVNFDPIENPSVPIGNMDPIADLEPSTCRVYLQDTGGGSDTRFLNVLEGADPGVAADPVALVRSSAGTAFDGAIIGNINTVVLFQNDPTVAFASVTYTVPATVTTHYVTGLTAGATYTVATSTSGGNVTVTVWPGGTLTADPAGVITFTVP